MRKLLETMYVLTPESYLYHRNENICISIGGEERASVVASQVDSIVLFGKNTFSTSLIGFCSEHGISVVFLDANGRFYGRVCGPVSGNVLLRKRQVREHGRRGILPLPDPGHAVRQNPQRKGHAHPPCTQREGGNGGPGDDTDGRAAFGAGGEVVRVR